jgi:GR25 family glycosyltransferase involved in LPS biosynthesis
MGFYRINTKNTSRESKPKQTMPQKRNNMVLIMYLTLTIINIMLFLHYTVISGLFHDINFHLLDSFTVRSLTSFIPEIRLSSPQHEPKPSYLNIPIYYINMDSDLGRRNFTETQLNSLGYSNYKRVRAWTEEDVHQRVNLRVNSIPNMMKANLREYGCIASHLMAMYTAITDYDKGSQDKDKENHTKSLRGSQKKHQDFPYALIIEDDVTFEFPVNWEEMISSIPNKNFSILQLATSNSEKTQVLWKDYLGMTTFPEQLTTDVQEKNSLDKVRSENQWFQRSWNSEFWSTQAYLINLNELRPLIEFIVQYSTEDKQHHITFFPPPNVVCTGVITVGDNNNNNNDNNFTPCILPFRIVADIYLYSLFQPTYISRIPLFNGVKDSLTIQESSIQDNGKKLHGHLKSFSEIELVIQEIRGSHLNKLPSYFLLPGK